MNQLMEANEADATCDPLWTNWTTFLACLRLDLGDQNQQFTAEIQLNALQQGTKPFETFIQEFQNIASVTTWYDTALIARFKHAINGPLLRSIYQTYPLPNTLIEWYQRGEQCNRQYREYLVESTKRGTSNTGTSRSNTQI